MHKKRLTNGTEILTVYPKATIYLSRQLMRDIQQYGIRLSPLCREAIRKEVERIELENKDNKFLGENI